MAIEVSNIQSMHATIEPSGSFAVDESGTISAPNWLPVPFREGTANLVLERPMGNPAHAQQRKDGRPLQVLLPKRASLTFEINMETLDARAGDGVAAAQGALGLLLSCVMGDETLGTGDTVGSADTASSFDVTTAARWEAGQAMGWQNSSGVMEVRQIESISGSTVTLKHAFTEAPSLSDVLYNCASYAMGYNSGDSEQSLQVLLRGLEADDRFLLLGGQLDSISIDLTNGQLPSLSLTFKFANWLQSDEAAGSLGGALATVTYANNAAIVVADSILSAGVVGTTAIASARYDIPASQLAFEPNIVYQEVSTPGGINNILKWERLHQPPVISGSFTLPFQDHTLWHDDRNNRTALDVMFQIGSSPTDGAIVLSAPTVQVVDWSQADANGIRAEQVSWEGRLDEDVASATTDLALSAFKIHLF